MTSAFFLSACGADHPGSDDGNARSDSAPGPLYEANTTVLEDRNHGPMLCPGGSAESLPPQCGDVPLANWDWRRVEGEETAGGAIWGSYHVVGTFDGQTFTVAEVGPYEDDPSSFGSDPDFSSPCRAPEGGWAGFENATQNDVQPADAYAQAQPDYVTSWITHLDPPALESGPVIFNAVFTDCAERHEAEIRKIWSGPLCVVARDGPTARELRRIRQEAEAGLEELGLKMLWSQGPAVPGVEPVIEIGVVVDVAGNGQAALDARYGPGVVRLIPALKPVS